MRKYVFLLFLTISGCLYATPKIRLPNNVVDGRCVLNQEMITKTNTTYIIRYSYDLEGKTIEIPEGSCLLFKRKGAIQNGSIVFNNNLVSNELFDNIYSAKGKIRSDKLFAERYGFFDDTEKLRFLLSQLTENVSLVLEHNKDYYINSLKSQSRVIYDEAFVRLVRSKNISIIGNGSTIHDSADKELIGMNLYSLIRFENCQNVTIHDITYNWQHETVFLPKVQGIIFLRTIDECKKFDIKMNVNNAGRGLYSGCWNYSGDPGRGLCDSKIEVHGYKVGYSIAIEKGDNLDIKNYFNIAHRGTYLAGVTNSRVYVEGKDAYSTMVNLLMTDTHDCNGCYFCDNIDATIVDIGSTDLTKGAVLMCQCNTYPQSYEQFRNRLPYNVSSINVHIKTPSNTNHIYEGFMFTDMAQVGDSVNVIVDGDLKDQSKASVLVRFWQSPSGNYTFNSVHGYNNNVVIRDRLPDNSNIIFNGCENIVFTERLFDKTNSSIVFKNCSFKSYNKYAGNAKEILPYITIE